MNCSWIKTFITAFLWMAVIAGAGAAVGAGNNECEVKAAPCKYGCCINGECGCSMAPAQTPEAPKPALPAQTSPVSKLMPLALPLADKGLRPLAGTPETRAVIMPEAARPHRPAALTLHCALLI
ncbi:MAG: hypothetical protein JNG86_21065 [Verrucomicrobiaceae bacterium]|nr:hypothetical protein [Verrucomicrobiaceae bacterium]